MSTATQTSKQTTDVLVAFQGWNAPWEKYNEKEIPLTTKSTLTSLVNQVKSQYSGSLATVAYGTDTNDDVKTKAKAFIERNLPIDEDGNQTGKLIVYGYSAGGDTAVELSQDIKASYRVDLLVTVDAALGWFSRGPTRNSVVPANVVTNLNYYTTTPKSRIGSRGVPHSPANKDVVVINHRCAGPTHGSMDEYTKLRVVQEILEVLYQMCMPRAAGADLQQCEETNAAPNREGR